MEWPQFADDSAVLVSSGNLATASFLLQKNLDSISSWLKLWKIKANESKSLQVTFATRQGICPPVILNNAEVPHSDHVRYLGIHLDRWLTWKNHIFTKRKQLGLQLRKLYWMFNRKSQLSIENKLLLYKVVLKPIWTYGVQLWGTASHSNIEIIQRFQSKMLRIITDAPWFVLNETLHHDLKIPTVKEVIKICTRNYSERITSHPNILACQLKSNEPTPRRLKKKIPWDQIYE